MGYDPPELVAFETRTWRLSDRRICLHPFDELEVVQGRASETGKCINIDEPLITFANRACRQEINLDLDETGSSHDSNPFDRLRDDRGLEIAFHRTIRMPDDDRLHQLPSSLGAFPLYNVSAYADKMPDNIVRQGGVFLPMWQREALWISFDAPHRQKHALRVFVGRINAISGLKMDERADEAQGTEVLQDYVVVPGQSWLDGTCVASGIVRQFVAMPCTWMKTRHLFTESPG
jgi:hypothetical protein